MNENETPALLELGRVSKADRIQRMVSGLLLMTLTLSGMLEKFDWRSFLAIAIQSELLITALVGWCPIYWGCRLKANESK